MQESFKILIVMPSHLVLEAERVTKLSVPTELGETTLLPGHMNFITELTPGVIKVFFEAREESKYFYIDSGFLEFHDSYVKILAEQVELSEDISLVELDKEAEQISKALLSRQSSPGEVSKALLAERKLLARRNLLAISSKQQSV